MPSRVEMKVWIEHILRGIVFALIGVMLLQSLRKRTDRTSETVSARGDGLTDALAKVSARAKSPSRIYLQLESLPSRPERAWLGALASGGSKVTWSGDNPPVMIDAEPIASPTGGTRILFAAPSGS